MDDREYEVWKDREDQHRKQRRKRKKKSKQRSAAAYAWDATSPIIPFAELIPTWQAAVLRYYARLADGMGREEAWNHNGTTVTRPWEELDADFRRSLEEVHDGYAS